MKIVFRCDASYLIGTGHVSRCLQLATKLQTRGHQVIFLSKILPEHYQSILRLQNIIYKELPDDSERLTHQNNVIEWLKAEKVNFLVIDHYEIDATWERAVRIDNLKIVVIDDIFNRLHDCDYLIDPNIINDENPYLHLTPPGVKFLLGPQFALISEKFKRSSRRRCVAPRWRILIFFGGSDPTQAILKYHQAWEELSQRHDLHVICGAANVSASEVKKLLEPNGIRVDLQLPDLAAVINDSDLFIGAGGSISWERCCSGLTGLALSVASNQESLASSLDRAMVHWYLGRVEEVTSDDILQKFRSLEENSETIQIYSENASALIAKSGLNNVVEALGL
jgi:UDP-2,4-diacetamido-2,4,6-trideoxy-beta-L-altropyranose hydrolase